MTRIFIGVAWPYANNAQHFGHVAGVYLPADIFARYHRLKGNEVLMVSGSDMHGTPITVTAEERGMKPEEVAEEFHKLNSENLKALGISYDLFTKTSTLHHEAVVHDIFLTLLNKGYIYKKTMNSMYCERCQRFLPDRYVEGKCPYCGVERARGDQCDTCGKPLDPLELVNPRCRFCGNLPIEKETEHFFLKLTALEPELKKYVSSQSHWKPRVLHFTQNWLEAGLRDRAITRDIEYGITVPVPGYEHKRIYVWFEAVIGYFSASKLWAELRNEPEYWKKFWLEDCQSYYFLGKDNIPFHTIIWPAILIGYGGLNLPYNVCANEYLTLEGAKLSKSRMAGGTIWLPDYLKQFSPDPLRYYLTVHMPELHDTDFSWDEFIERNNADLVNTLGNFVHRALSFAVKHFGVVPEAHELDEYDRTAIKKIEETVARAGELLENCRFKDAMATVMELAHFANKYFNDKGPWESIKNNREKCETTLHIALRIARSLAVLIAPFMPFSAETLWYMLGQRMPIQRWEDALSDIQSGKVLYSPKPLFSKIVPPQSEEKWPSEEFAMLDLRVGTVIEVNTHPDAEKLYVLRVNLGSEARQIVAGIRGYYEKEELVGKQVVVVCNLECAELRGIRSEGMLLAAQDSKNLALVIPSEPTNAGERVGLQGTEISTTQTKISFQEFQKFNICIEKIDGKNCVVFTSSTGNKKILVTDNIALTVDREIEPGTKVR